jgi:hypothetical protein
MSAYRITVALALVCLTTAGYGQLTDQMAAGRVLGPHWREVSRSSGMIFSGTVVKIEPLSVAKGQALPLVLTRFRVDRAIAGVKAGEVLTMREWAGAWDSHDTMSTGQHLLIFLYPVSRLGLTSPVGGRQGQIRLDARGELVISPWTQAESSAEKPNARCAGNDGEDDNRSPGRKVSLKRYPDARGNRFSSCAPHPDTTITFMQIERAIRHARGE